MIVTERFAPSPSGPLHLGHAFSAITAWEAARRAGGRFALRIENIDVTRARSEWETQIYDDLRWLGLDWIEPVYRQSERMPQYWAALKRLWAEGLLYQCTCNRRDILAMAVAPQEGAAPVGPDGVIYPGTCRSTSRQGAMPRNAVLRLDIARAFEGVQQISFEEIGTNPGTKRLLPAEMIRTVGDPILARKGLGTSYHLAVVVDDAAQEITHVTRGEDLWEATWIHVVLQRLLGHPTPIYRHHRLIRDDAGRRLAKRDDARAIAQYREQGVSPTEIRAMVGL